MFKKAIICLLIIAILFTSLSFTKNHSVKVEEPIAFQDKLTSVQSENSNIIGEPAVVDRPVESSSNQTNEDISDKGEVTFAQQFPNIHTAEVIAKKFGKSVNDEMDKMC